jgi:hypothetical protein
VSDTTTLVGLPTARRVARARAARRIFLALIFLLVIAGLAERVGVRSATASVAGGGYKMNVTYARVTRPGLDTPFTINVHRDRPLPSELTIAVSTTYLQLFDKNGGLDPDPSDTASSAHWVYWTFTTAPGRSMRVALDAILAMGQQWGHDGDVRLLDNGHQLLETKFHTWVAP